MRKNLNYHKKVIHHNKIKNFINNEMLKKLKMINPPNHYSNIKNYIRFKTTQIITITTRIIKIIIKTKIKVINSSIK